MANKADRLSVARLELAGRASSLGPKLSRPPIWRAMAGYMIVAAIAFCGFAVTRWLLAFALTRSYAALAIGIGAALLALRSPLLSYLLDRSLRRG